VFSAARKGLFSYNNAILKQARLFSSLLNKLPLSLQGRILWHSLPASPFEPNVFAAYKCPVTKEQFTLELTNEKRIKVRLKLPTEEPREVFSFSSDEIPNGWHIPGLNYGPRKWPGTP
jgi:hypothetical protein